MTTEGLFEKHNDEFLKFNRIPLASRLHPRPDLCAMLYLHEKFGGSGNAVSHAEHDEIHLDWEPDEGVMTEDDVIYLTRCGVRYGEYGLCMFV